MALGIAIHLSEGDVRTALVGLGVAWAIHYLLFRLGVERGGDAKLFMAIGALRGWSEAVEATLWSAFVYLPVGLLVLLLQGKLGNLMAALRWTASGRAKGEPRPEPTMLKTAPIVAVAWLMAWATHWLSPTP
jgi:Flp pilus assembly protein protease CpaA